MVITRRHNHPQLATPPTCDHCGNTGHVSSICPCSAYLPKMPALHGTACILTCRSGYEDEPDSNQIVVTIDPCTLSSSPVVRPSKPSTAPGPQHKHTPLELALYPLPSFLPSLHRLPIVSAVTSHCSCRHSTYSHCHSSSTFATTPSSLSHEDSAYCRSGS